MFGDIIQNTKQWKQIPLGELGSFKTGGTPSSKHPEYFEGKVPWISSTALGDNFIDASYAKHFITQDAIDNSATALIPPGSLIIGTRINVGQSSVNVDALCTSQDVVSMMDISTDFEPLFIKFCIDQYIPYLEGQKKGATIKGITVAILKSLLIPMPSKDLQKNYIDFIRQVDKSKSIFQRMVSQYDELVKSRFIEMFSDVKNKKRMSALGICKNGLNFKKTTNGFKIKCIGVGDFQDNLSTDQINQIEEIQIDRNISGPFLKDGDIVFVRSNGNKELVGRSILVKSIPEKTSFSGFCIAFNLQSTQIIPEFLIHYLHLDSTRQSMFGNSRGSNISNLTQGMILDVEVPIPEIEMQKQFIEFVQQVDKSKARLFDKMLSSLQVSTS